MLLFSSNSQVLFNVVSTKLILVIPATGHFLAQLSEDPTVF
jgi:hypothetical protein